MFEKSFRLSEMTKIHILSAKLVIMILNFRKTDIMGFITVFRRISMKIFQLNK